MTLKEIIKIADEAYGDGLIQNYFDNPGGQFGDGLARFIAVELRETYDDTATDDEQLNEAAHTMESAMLQLREVTLAFDRRR